MNPLVPWAHIDTVLLDMDGTLLDLHFDNHFWQTHLPQRYAESLDRPHDVVRHELMTRYRQGAGTLDWYSVDFWQNELGLDIMCLKEEVAHLIAVHPHVLTFLSAIRLSGRRIVLATNAHHKSVALKMARTGLTPHFDAIISSHALGAAKEEQAFWQHLNKIEPFDPARTLLVDDSLPVLDSARRYGIAHLVAVKKPDTRQPQKNTADYPAIDDFSQLLPK
ncbi:haloacid dehalogenase [Rugosibacter aromaticivorans]|uniref:Haloacid dehalogenase n=1 Tax=Rugosibacter aromaticivorans TaxID=1565605 RepID=A0A0C5J6Q5_9PROT|nr:GMP/IMP nucleotidase [Rugosibacter aromaticivorans]AJP47408.1 haloacid dehalogenase [Rugosibacter aromaticivorans]TBR13857.1 MAG: GMP/IMP nucleotidase [Rugosibacter sp.]